uniref:Filamentous hemeagglutinin outer membrane protein n=1 Tax=Geobacter sp. (strain M21) TaxID=443144 RepID=C6E631_GEOSM
MKKAVIDAGIHSEQRPGRAEAPAGLEGLKPCAGFLGNMSGRARMNLMASIVMTLLFTGFCVTSYFMPDTAYAWPTKYTSCSSCHAQVDPNATITAAINGAVGTSVTVAPGGSFEVDWKVTNVTNAAGGQVGVGVEIDLPTGWGLAKGTVNAPGIPGWTSVWDAASGVPAGWATANSYSTSAEFPNSPVGYTINYDSTAWDTGSRNAAYDNATAGKDLDGIADNMGTDAIVTVPAGATPGTYTMVVMGVGHDSAKSYVAQAITVTVSGAGGDSAKPVVSAGFAATTPSLSRTIAVSGFAATDDTGVTGYMITTSAAAPLAGDAGWLTSAPASYTVASDGSYTLYPWAKDAAGNVSLAYGAPVTVLVDTVKPTVSSTIPANGATATNLNGAVTLNFSESVNCATVTTGTVTISPAVGWTRSSCSGSQAIFTPSGQSNSTSYTVTVGASVADTAGNTLAASYPFGYTTSAPAPNNPPALPASLTQYKSDGTTVLSRGLYTNLTTLIFKGTLTDPDSDAVQLDIELADVGAAFTGLPTCSSTLVVSGTTAAATCSSIANGRFKWQARATDSKGSTGSWTQY